MGEKKKLAKAFMQLTAKAVAEEIAEPGLFSGKVLETEHFFECIRDPKDAPVKVGNTARLIDMRNHIAVFIGVNCVGSVLSGHAAELRERYKLNTRASRSITAKVCEVSEISATFVVRI